LWGAQTAELWGFRFLNTLFYIFNLLFLIVCHHFSRDSGNLRASSQRRIKKLLLHFSRIHLDRVGVKALLGAVGLFVFLNVLGFYLKKRLPTPSENLNVILVQHNISLKDKDFKPFKSFKQKSFYALRTLTYHSLKQMKKDRLKAEDIDFILWPEGAYPYIIDKNQKRTAGLSKLVRVLKIPLVTGALARDGDHYSNSLVVYGREGNILKPVYDKMKLLIFGEYIPLTDKWPFLKKLFPYFGDNLTPGVSTQVQ
ncbi:MAG: hypothetical protein OXN83_02390, partial [Oligoflexia bacterium]|nr:hypothetical protein [Oligoflexia bacterium]